MYVSKDIQYNYSFDWLVDIVTEWVDGFCFALFLNLSENLVFNNKLCFNILLSFFKNGPILTLQGNMYHQHLISSIKKINTLAVR